MFFLGEFKYINDTIITMFRNMLFLLMNKLLQYFFIITIIINIYKFVQLMMCMKPLPTVNITRVGFNTFEGSQGNIIIIFQCQYNTKQKKLEIPHKLFDKNKI